MKVKRFLVRVFKKSLIVFFVIILLAITTYIIYDNTASDELSIQESYETKKEKYELLKKIERDLIEEGKGINIHEIPSKYIRYKIYNEGENIVFYYYIEEEYSSGDTYSAKITLSNNYKTLDEEYSIELEDYETYKNTMQCLEKFYSVILALCVLIFILVGCLICMSVYFSIKWLLNRFKSRKLKE